MSDRTFRFEVCILDDNGAVTTKEYVTFDPHDTDSYGDNETVMMAVQAWLKRAKYDAQQLDLEAAQIEWAAEERADHHYRLSRERAYP